MTMALSAVARHGGVRERALIFRSGDRSFAIDLAHAIEIVNDVDLTPLAIPQGIVSGDIILRGRALSAVDPLNLLGAPARSLGSFAIVTTTGSTEVAFLADAIHGVRAVPEPQPVGWLDDEHPFGRGFTLPDLGLVLLLAPDRLRLRQRTAATRGELAAIDQLDAARPQEEGRKFLAFVRGTERFAVDAMAVGRICHASRTYRLPASVRSRVQEVIEVGSQVLPIVELPAPASADAGLVLTIEANGGPVAVRCDRIDGLVDVMSAEIGKTPLLDGRLIRTLRSGSSVYQLIGGEGAVGLLPGVTADV